MPQIIPIIAEGFVKKPDNEESTKVPDWADMLVETAIADATAAGMPVQDVLAELMRGQYQRGIFEMSPWKRIAIGQLDEKPDGVLSPAEVYDRLNDQNDKFLARIQDATTKYLKAEYFSKEILKVVEPMEKQLKEAYGYLLKLREIYLENPDRRKPEDLEKLCEDVHLFTHDGKPLKLPNVKK